MNIKKIIFLISIIVFSTQLSAQTLASKLKGLTKAAPIDLVNKKIVLDGKTVPVFNEKGEQLTQDVITSLMMKNTYKPEFYLNTKKDIKAIVMRSVSKKEQAKMKAAYEKIGIKEKGALVGKKAIDFSVTDINGKTYSLTTLKGKTVVLNFWFIRCKPCVKEIPELNKLVETYKDNKNVVFLGLATDSKSKLETFLRQKKFNYNIVPASKSVAKKYNVFGYPTHIVIDAKGIIQFETSGLSSATIPSLEKAIENSL